MSLDELSDEVTLRLPRSLLDRLGDLARERNVELNAATIEALEAGLAWRAEDDPLAPLREAESRPALARYDEAEVDEMLAPMREDMRGVLADLQWSRRKRA